MSAAWPKLKDALTTMKEVHFDSRQVFEAEPGVVLGRYVIRRTIKADGTMAIRKFKG